MVGDEGTAEQRASRASLHMKPSACPPASSAQPAGLSPLLSLSGLPVSSAQPAGLSPLLSLPTSVLWGLSSLAQLSFLESYMFIISKTKNLDENIILKSRFCPLNFIIFPKYHESHSNSNYKHENENKYL